MSQLMPVVNGGHVQRYPPLGRLLHTPVRHGFDEQPREIVSQRVPKADGERRRQLLVVSMRNNGLPTYSGGQVHCQNGKLPRETHTPPLRQGDERQGS